MQNLKYVLMELGNRLVTAHKFYPAMRRSDATIEPRSTTMILLFTEWLNETPEAQAVLAEMEIAWPVVLKKPEVVK